MSINLYEVYVQTDRVEDVSSFLAEWLRSTSEEEPIVETGQDAVFPFFKNEVPSLFAVTAASKDWVRVLHDAYEPPFDLASRLSAELSSTVIHAIGQSTVDTYYLSVHKDGQMVRKIHSSEDTDGVEHEGEPFSFEQELVSEGFFDYEDMHDFCENFGIDLLTDPSELDGTWTMIKIEEKQVLSKRSFFQKLADRFLGNR